MSPAANLSNVAAAGKQVKTAADLMVASGDHLDRLVAFEMTSVDLGANVDTGGAFDYRGWTAERCGYRWVPATSAV